MSTQNAPEEVHIVRTSGRRAERTCLKPFLTAENNKNMLIMMNHFAQECRSGSVLAERRALGVWTKMSGFRGWYTSSCTGEGQGFALYPNKRVKVGLSHHATGCVNRLRSGLILRHKQQNAYAYQRQQYEPESFHLSKTSAKIQKLFHICKYLWDFYYLSMFMPFVFCACWYSVGDCPVWNLKYLRKVNCSGKPSSYATE